MGWASGHIERLRRGEKVSFRPRGNSMQGRIESGQLVTVEPITDYTTLKPGDIVLCRVAGKEYLHLVDTIRYQHAATAEEAFRKAKYRITNNKGHINGWVSARSIFGICTHVES